ncbi:MAG: universal stress protein [Thermodesulfobacteriota bacterium]
MKEIKRILYPVDFSENSYHVLPYVISLSDKYNAQVYILYVVDDLRRYAGIHVPHPSISQIIDEAMAAGKKMLNQICDEHLQRCPNFQKRIVSGDPRKEIMKMIEDEEIDLVIMGTHGRKGIERAIFGSVAEYVVKNSKVPVLTINPLKEKKEA